MTEAEEVEYKLLLEAINLKYGYDFRGYAAGSLARRMKALLAKFRLPDFSQLMQRLLKEPDFFRTILPHMTVGTSEMFRDPQFYKSVRAEIIPALRTFASLNVWIAGCSTGQEAYSVAIMLHEEGLLDRTVIFATDVNPAALKAAREGIFAADTIQQYTRNYVESGGTKAFSEYYTADYGYVRMASNLKDNMVFSEHNLGTDGVFSEMNLVMCRNVLIYFDKDLQNRVLNLFRESLRFRGFLCLGSKENLRFSNQALSFETVDVRNKIYQKSSGSL